MFLYASRISLSNAHLHAEKTGSRIATRTFHSPFFGCDPASRFSVPKPSKRQLGGFCRSRAARLVVRCPYCSTLLLLSLSYSGSRQGKPALIFVGNVRLLGYQLNVDAAAFSGINQGFDLKRTVRVAIHQLAHSRLAQPYNAGKRDLSQVAISGELSNLSDQYAPRTDRRAVARPLVELQ